jgi:polyferredoxin
MSPTDPVLWLLAASMALVTSYSLKWTVTHRSRPGSLMIPFVIFVLLMMLSMVVSAVIYFSGPSLSTLVTLVVANMFVMGLGSLPFVLVIFRSLLSEEGAHSGGVVPGKPEGPVDSPGRKGVWGGAGASVAVIALVLLNEFFMGWAFQLASGGFPPSVGADWLSIVSSVVGSYWFLFTMSFEMALTTYFLRNEIPRTYLYIVAFQSAIMFLSPTALPDGNWIAASVFAGSSVMVVLFIFLFEYLSRNSMVDRRLSRYLLILLTTYAAMMAGLYLWELNSSETIFALSILLEMGLYLGLVVGPKDAASLKTWRSDPWWVLGLLSALFVGEFFMGALLDAQVNGPQDLVSAAGFVAIAGSPLAALTAALYDFLGFFSAVTLSPWFLIMMGTEMGALVVFRIREVRELETRVRLGLVIVAYAVYAVLLPSFLIPGDALPNVPFVGWSMGVGTAGPVAPAILAALLGTYLISGILSVLFGSRQVCSVFCTAALMYQGTFYDSLKTFNRTSTVGKKLLTSRLSGIYRATFSIVWISLIVAIAVSYLDSVGVLGFSILGSDPVVFLYTFYFGFLWYIVFVTIPFVGTYACVTTGFCHWGTFNQLVSRLGFFKLKVKDPATCVTCVTKDCAKACPVGLTDLPGSFIAKGEFKSSKCIGVGDCVGACPYNNEYFYDVRTWLKRGRGGKKGLGMIDLEVVHSPGPGRRSNVE